MSSSGSPFHHLPFGVVDGHNFALHPAGYRHGINRSHRSERVDVHPMSPCFAVAVVIGIPRTGAWFAFSCSAFAASYCRYMNAMMSTPTTATIAHTHQLLFSGGAVGSGSGCNGRGETAVLVEFGILVGVGFSVMKLRQHVVIEPHIGRWRGTGAPR